ncbi:FUSC family protein [Streptomyces sp. Tu 3180]|uniref:FUSC family protein n=1 Tax=Streptomyces sp. Tu 3180 TaxID=2682611 RepID=UPI001356C5FC|nr:FUSC family protein [Streptomyces sp. Tu 3180]KAF3463746.1 FUSC family protein [Streptomyces sp. Tu 3180]
MRAAGRPVRARLRDRLAASDPGLLRLTAGLRTVTAIALTLAVLASTGFGITRLVTGAMAAMVATFSVREKRRAAQAVTLALGLPVALVSVSLGAVLNEWVVVGDVFFVVLIFCAVYGRRFGERGTALGLIGFQLYFVSLFVGASAAQLPGLWAALTVAFACSAVVRFAVVPVTPAGLLARLRRAFRVRLAQLVSAQLALLDAGPDGPDEVDKALEDVRTGTSRLHETALMIQTRLEEGTPDESTARLVQRRIADAEIAAERLTLLLLSARSTERADTLTLHLPGAPAPRVGRLPGPEEATALLRRDLLALRALVLRTGTPGTAVAQVRNRLLGYRDEENLPAATPAVRDVFRAVGEAARAVMGLRIALDGPQDESDDTPATARSREELDAEDAAIDAGGESGRDEQPTGLRRPTTRAAVQVTVGSTLAVVGGELLSADRWYWAVLACWIVFINTASTGEILVKGYRRVLGTVFGVGAGIVLAGLVGGHTVAAFALVLVLVFAMFYTAPLSYTLMSFFVTAMLGLLYTLLHTYSWEVLVLRLEETALGAACGVVAAALVLPVNTDRRTNELLVTVLERLAGVTEAAVGQLSGKAADDLLDKARELDRALGDLRGATQPLTHPVTPLRARRTTARYVVALLETCAYHARSLAATAELLPSHPSIAADPRLRAAAGRTVRNIGTIADRVADGKVTAAVGTGPSIASLLGDSDGVARHGRITGRVLRHLERLDEAVVGLARPLGVPVAAPER